MMMIYLLSVCRSIKYYIYCMLFLFSLGMAFPAFAAPVSDREIPDSLRLAALEKLLNSPAVDSTNFAVLITDLDSGKVLAHHAPAKPLIPASIQKSVTIASLLSERKPDWRFLTKVYLDGKVKSGILNGNIIVKGAMDPTLNSKSEPKSADFISEIVNALKNKGVDSIAGAIIVDESDFEGSSCPPSWGAANMKASYGTGSHALNFEGNASGKSAVQNVKPVFISRLISALNRNGIKVGNNGLAEGRRSLLLTHQSAPLDEIMRSCMMRSDNLFAESLLRSFSEASGGNGSTENGAEREMRLWKRRGAPMKNVEIIDGSGLSRSNRMTAKFLTYVLSEMADNVDYVSFFPLAGQEGTLRNFMKDSRLDSYLAMKTGSMTGIQCYAGYLLDEDFAPTHTIVVIVNNMPDRSSLRSALADFFLSIF